MKIEVDVLGVEQAVDFNSLSTSQFVVLEVLGNTLRVPITEEQLESLTRHAAGRQVASAASTWAETREQGNADPGLISEEIPEREHSLQDAAVPEYEGVMRELTDEAPGEEAPAGILDGFFDESEEEKARKLRSKKPQRRTVPRDEAGNPVVEQMPQLPQMQTFGTSLSDDDGFAQG